MNYVIDGLQLLCVGILSVVCYIVWARHAPGNQPGEAAMNDLLAKAKEALDAHVEASKVKVDAHGESTMAYVADKVRAAKNEALSDIGKVGANVLSIVRNKNPAVPVSTASSPLAPSQSVAAKPLDGGTVHASAIGMGGGSGLTPVGPFIVTTSAWKSPDGKGGGATQETKIVVPKTIGASMTPLIGTLERQMRAHQVDTNFATAELQAALGEQMNEYINAYGVGGQFYDPTLNMEAARSYQLSVVTPARFAWAGYVKRGDASVEGGTFKWLPAAFPAYA